MHIYWRVQQDLNELGSTMKFHHPNLIREYRQWVKRNTTGLALAQGLTWNHIQRWTTNLN